MKLMKSLVLIMVFAVIGLGASQRPGAGPEPMPGDMAPDFTLNTQDGSQSITLSELSGRPTALVFASYT
jgi:cytochrome oxidase Cu insertion factor (SCO1/SenC/PrrC family)